MIDVERGQLGEAHFSIDRKYRYLLTRGPAAAEQRVCWVMCNPSTADHDVNDPTIAKVIKFSNRIAAEASLAPPAISIVNIFAFRATDPDVMLADPRPIGGQANDEAILAAARAAWLVIAAWGAVTGTERRGREVRALLVGAGIRLHRLGKLTKNGSPRHPLYVRDAEELVPWV